MKTRENGENGEKKLENPQTQRFERENGKLKESMMKRKKIYIDRSKWRTGGIPTTIKESGARKAYRTGKGRTQLQNKEGYMCCLGFIINQSCPNADIELATDPNDTNEIIPGLTILDQFSYTKCIRNTDLSGLAMLINDDCTLTPRKKELKLRTLFKDSPYQLVFEGEYTEYE